MIKLSDDQKFKICSEPYLLVLSGQRRSVVRCECHCGKLFLGRVDHIKQSNPIKSCGCLLNAVRKKGGHNKKAPGLAAANSVYSSYRDKCKRKDIAFEITLDDFIKITTQNCFYCGSPPTASYGEYFVTGIRAGMKKVNGTYVYNGIDRIDPNSGYVHGNMRACCTYCNFAKSNRNEKDFFDWIKRLIAYQTAK